MLLGLEDVEQAAASEEAKTEVADPAERGHRSPRRRMNRGSLAAHLPRIEMVVDIEDRMRARAAATPCTGSARMSASGSTSCRRSSACWCPPAQICLPGLRELVVQAPAPARLIEGGLPTEATVAQVLVSKYADHLPLYRQAQIYARQGINLDRSTLADWVGRAAFLLRPVHERLLTASAQSLGQAVRRRDDGAGARSWPRQDQDRPALGPTRGTIDPGVAPTRPASPMSTRRIARRSGRSPISPASRASCRSTATAAIACSPSAATYNWPSAGAMCAAASTNSPQAGPAPIASEALERIAGSMPIENEIRGRSAEERYAATPGAEPADDRRT
jgi:transposase